VTSPRIRYQDVVPYERPRTLAALRGPVAGHLELPHSVHWGPDRVLDLAVLDEVVPGYQAIVREGTVQQQEALLDRDLLLRVWTDMVLPGRCRDVWESAFPELAGRPVGSGG
jgi:hypothetical protein